MAEARAAFPSFAKGEIAPALYGRFDVGPYAVAAKRARNMVVLKYGGLTMRPGTRYVGEVYDAAHDLRLLPFQFSLEQAYALEMGQGYMRPVALGGQVLETELAITGITNEAQAVVTSAYHGYAAGDDVYFQGVAGMTEINGRVARVVASISDNQFRIDLDTRSYGAFTGAAGGVTRTEAPAPPPPPPTVPPPYTPPDPPDTTGGWHPGMEIP